jgi:16S rRNA (cytosine1402-N4)-methyltransferase
MANAEKAHTSVMQQEVIGFLPKAEHGLVIDATLGAGGHSEAILSNTPEGITLVGLDRDPEALALASQRLEPFGQRFRAVHGTFGEAREVLDRAGLTSEALFLLADIGLSSMQLDSTTRGFSFRFDADLDMRMDPGSEGPRAIDLIDRKTPDELAELLLKYGDVGASLRLAKALKVARRAGQISGTKDLAEFCRGFFGDHGKIHAATRVFQALRIAVNREWENLDALLAGLPELLAPGGVAVIISFHSMEDRLVKHAFRTMGAAGTLEILTPKPLVPSRAEQRANPRSRSAKLRAARRVC